MGLIGEECTPCRETKTTILLGRGGGEHGRGQTNSLVTSERQSLGLSLSLSLAGIAYDGYCREGRVSKGH